MGWCRSQTQVRGQCTAYVCESCLTQLQRKGEVALPCVIQGKCSFNRGESKHSAWGIRERQGQGQIQEDWQNLRITNSQNKLSWKAPQGSPIPTPNCTMPFLRVTPCAWEHFSNTSWALVGLVPLATSLGSLFQYSSILWVRNLFPIFNLNIP